MVFFEQVSRAMPWVDSFVFGVSHGMNGVEGTVRKAHVCNRIADGKNQRQVGESSHAVGIRKSDQNHDL